MIDDLFFQMKIAETARQLDLDFRVAMTVEPFLELARSHPKLALVDLNARADAIAVVKRLRESEDGGQTRLRVIGFLSHVQRDLAARAQEAGCDEILPRSALSQNLPAILRQVRQVKE